MSFSDPPRRPQPILALLLVLVAACGAPPTPEEPASRTPWERPVDGAVAVTAWRDEGAPSSPFGPGGFPWESPEQLVESMASSLAASGGVRTDRAITERRADGSVIGWVRAELTAPGAESAVAVDLRLTMRRDADAWFVARSASREYCVRPLTDGTCQ